MFKILRALKVEKGSVKLILDISVPKWGDFCIHGIKVMEKDGKRWVSLPSQKVDLPSGEVRYLPYNRFEQRTRQDEFSGKIIESYEYWVSQGNKPQEPRPKEEVQQAAPPAYGAGSNGAYEEIPF